MLGVVQPMRSLSLSTWLMVQRSGGLHFQGRTGRNFGRDIDIERDPPGGVVVG